jgi:hypothetical protein
MEAQASTRVRKATLLVLRESVSRESPSIAFFGHFDFHSGRVRRIQLGGTHNRELGKDFVEDARDEIILPILVAPPHLSETDCFHCHGAFRVRGSSKPVNAKAGTNGLW